jgi:hypothetical protein
LKSPSPRVGGGEKGEIKMSNENGGEIQGFYSQSASISKIAGALLKAQKAIGAAKKDSVNPFFKAKYADLGAVMEVCKEPLNENGIAILQPIVSNGDVYVLTTLLHESGEFISSQLKIAAKQEHDPQAQGSAITYARRYALQSLLSIPSEDDDGEKAMRRDAPAKPPMQAPKPMTGGMATAALGAGLLTVVFMPSSVEAKTKKDGVGKYWIITNGQMKFNTTNSKEAETAQKALSEGREVQITYSVNGIYNNIKSLALKLPKPPTPGTLDAILVDSEEEAAEVVE